mgnify:FL=1
MSKDSLWFVGCVNFLSATVIEKKSFINIIVEVVSQCCTRCNDLAGCFNLGLNCYTDYSPFQCYSQAVYDNCCLFCEHNRKVR